MRFARREAARLSPLPARDGPSIFMVMAAGRFRAAGSGTGRCVWAGAGSVGAQECEQIHSAGVALLRRDRTRTRTMLREVWRIACAGREAPRAIHAGWSAAASPELANASSPGAPEQLRE